jgi:uncharacterized protein YbjT (DUF2867 family)
MRVLVAGASGFVGRRLCATLEDAGHAVRAMTRRPESYEGAGEAVQADVQDTRSLAAAVRGCDAAYYLVHSLDKASFEKTMRPRLAPSGVRRRAQLRRIIYLGGLGNDDDELSRHLRSRREVEKLLADAGVPVTTLRAGVIVGHGGLSWEITRQLVEHLPAMITPR